VMIFRLYLNLFEDFVILRAGKVKMYGIGWHL
jgi:hypothetical protein